MQEMFSQQEVDLAIAPHYLPDGESVVFRVSPTIWYCSADYTLHPGEPIPLVLLDEPIHYQNILFEKLSEAELQWRVASIWHRHYRPLVLRWKRV